MDSIVDHIILDKIKLEILHKPEGEIPQRRQLIDQVIEWAIPKSTSADEISCAVKAFMVADPPDELISFLERINLYRSDYSDDKNLEKLLLINAIRADLSIVASYIDLLNNFNAKDIALTCVSKNHMLYETIFTIYCNFSKPVYTTEKDKQIEM